MNHIWLQLSSWHHLWSVTSCLSLPHPPRPNEPQSLSLREEKKRLPLSTLKKNDTWIRKVSHSNSHCACQSVGKLKLHNGHRFPFSHSYYASLIKQRHAARLNAGIITVTQKNNTHLSWSRHPIILSSSEGVWRSELGNSKSHSQPYCGVSYHGNLALLDSGPVSSSSPCGCFARAVAVWVSL